MGEPFRVQRLAVWVLVTLFLHDGGGQGVKAEERPIKIVALGDRLPPASAAGGGGVLTKLAEALRPKLLSQSLMQACPATQSGGLAAPDWSVPEALRKVILGRC